MNAPTSMSNKKIRKELFEVNYLAWDIRFDSETLTFLHHGTEDGRNVKTFA